MLRMKSQMPWQAAILLPSMLLLSACAAKHLAPAPVIGEDIATIKKGDSAPFNGVLFSPQYLNEYLQWKCKEMGTC